MWPWCGLWAWPVLEGIALERRERVGVILALFALSTTACKPGLPLVGANGLGGLVRVVAVLSLELLHQVDVLFLGGGGGRACIDLLLPRLVFGLALQIEHSWRRGLGDVLAICNLEESVEFKQFLVTWLGLELAAVISGLCEGCGRHCV